MKDKVLMGRGREFTTIAQRELEHHLELGPEHGKTRLAFMSAHHHRIRDYAVVQLAREGAPIAPEIFSEALKIPLDRVNTILSELEKHLFFLVRNESKAVAWAFPITSDETPHRLIFSTGEKIFAA